jgi:CubicO group peptidase (beta-lactamase class C family)
MRIEASTGARGTTRLPGALGDLRGTVLIEREGRCLLRAAGGTTGATPAAAIDVSTRFQLASVSKQFTAAALLLLVDRGKLSLEDHLVDVLDGCPGIWEPITLHQLLCHTAGLTHWPQLPHLDLCAPCDPDQLFKIFAEAPLVAAPGQRYEYSSPGYVLAARVVERASGEPYRDFLADELFAPLGMHATFAGNPRGEQNLAVPHHEGAPTPSFELDVVGMGAGDAWSTIEDMARWDRALEEGLVLSDASREALITPHVPMPEELPGVTFHGYGYGWIVADLAGTPGFFHTGGNAGFRSINVVLPEHDARIVLLTNEDQADLLAFALEALEVATAGVD